MAYNINFIERKYYYSGLEEKDRKRNLRFLFCELVRMINLRRSRKVFTKNLNR